MPGKFTLKRKIAAVLASGNVGSHALILDEARRCSVAQSSELHGNQGTFAKRHGLDRTYLNAILNGRRLASGSSRIMNVLGLRRVYALPRNNRQ